eukprot:Ihof_evm13s29 gene=Ihof_evmTU13s29
MVHMTEKQAGQPDLYSWIILMNICMLTFGSYWVYDTPGALQTQLQEWFGGPDKYTKAMNLNLYSIYSYPNIFLSFLGGFVIDRWLGVQKATLLFGLFVLAGQMLFSFGIEYKMYELCLFGRLVFGLGGENLTVAQNAYTVRWFNGPLLALSFGIVLCCSRLGSSINFLVTPTLAQAGVPFSIWFGTAACIASFASTIILSILDYRGREKIKAEVIEEKISITHVARMPLTAWLIFLCCFFFYIAILTFYTVACDIMQHTGRHYDAQTAAMFLAIPNMVALFSFPVVGWLLDKYGNSLMWLLVACLMELVAHLIFLGNANDYFQVHVVIVMAWLGLAYSFGASALWPMISFVIPNAFLGTAYGLMTALQNTGLALAPQLIGIVQEMDGIKGTNMVYNAPIFLFMLCSIMASLITICLLFMDKYYLGRLNSSADQRAQMAPPRFA